jgi:peptidoglycan hydrolase CwlO-like protein
MGGFCATGDKQLSMEEKEMSDLLSEIEAAVDSLEDEEEELDFPGETHEEFESKMQEVQGQIEFLRDVLQKE